VDLAPSSAIYREPRIVDALAPGLCVSAMPLTDVWIEGPGNKDQENGPVIGRHGRGCKPICRVSALSRYPLAIA